ncbi:6-phospho-beta-glucosidase [Mobilisporobacter senegalensis]|uniref:6-phospho-beta-glucosidase n=1 Tax=Mobilisporobacter senegalensis TaxID=1329262 RepID=A0A3N1XXR2_9FIRM|nr:6-phospho-beta-glucosidase [Mobilisporobacter senegalensis]ROR31413.1 6-phospho-beta-glucosidase [Mobilisporobacter senegalensis]
MKITVIGGGGVRSMFLAKSLAQNGKRLGITKIVFMDNNEKKLNIYGKMAKQVANRIDSSLNFSLTSDPIKAIEEADYIITTIRVGEDEMRIKDEKTALSHNLLGQETTGAAGFSFAMRSVPVLADYCELIKKHGKKDVKVFNFTNPAGVVSQTLRDMGYDFTYGICDAPSSLLHSFAKLYGVSQDEVTGECYGLNHLSFFKSIKLNGREIMPELLQDDRIYSETDMRFFEKELVLHIGCILNEYLYYFYYREEAISNILAANVTRGEVIRDINIQMTNELSKMDVEGDFDNCLRVFEKWYDKRETAYMANETGVKSKKPAFKFDIYEKDSGGYAGVALKYIEAELSNEPQDMILCVPNNGAIKGLKNTDVVEISCTITKDGYIPHKFEELEELPMELIRRVKVYERLASEAIRNRNIQQAIDCLMVHPLVNSYSLAKTLVNQYLTTNDEYIEGWN